MGCNRGYGYNNGCGGFYNGGCNNGCGCGYNFSSCGGCGGYDGGCSSFDKIQVLTPTDQLLIQTVPHLFYSQNGFVKANPYAEHVVLSQGVSSPVSLGWF